MLKNYPYRDQDTGGGGGISDENLRNRLKDIQLAEDNLQSQKDLLKEEILKLSQEEQTISTQLFEKYGKGEVNIEDGTITPVE